MTADAATRNKAIVAALSKRLSDLSLNTEQVAGKTFEGQDISSLFSSILQLKGNHDCLSNKDEVMKWVGFADEFPSDGDACNSVLTSLNDVLADKSVLIGEGFKSSEADVVVFSALHSFVGSLSKEDMQKIPNVMRWMDYIQNVEDFHGILQKILVEMAAFKHPGTNGLKNGDNLDAKRNLDKASLTPKYLEKAPVEAKKDATKKAPSENKSSEVKLKAPAKETLTKNVEVSINALNIQVGIIKKAWKHPSADSLLVEEIDVGEGKPRQVVSGLAKYYNPDDLTNRRVALITNVKPGKLRDVGSSGYYALLMKTKLLWSHCYCQKVQRLGRGFLFLGMLQFRVLAQSGVPVINWSCSCAIKLSENAKLSLFCLFFNFTTILLKISYAFSQSYILKVQRLGRLLESLDMFQF